MTVQGTVGPVAARYGRTYQGHPRKAADALQAARRHAQEARQAGDRTLAEEWEEVADVLEAILAQRRRCRICGRGLRHPDSVASGIGPECARKAR